jgi:hypothetical protein
MPNHQIVECYIVFSEMEAAKKMDDSSAVVCAELSNHEIFEKWRIVDIAGLTGDRLAECDRDRNESNRRYNEAFKVVLSHTSALELQEFWKLFAIKPSDGYRTETGMHGSEDLGECFGGKRKGSTFGDANLTSTNPMYNDRAAPQNDDSQGIDLGAGTRLSGERKCSAFGHTNPMSSNSMFDDRLAQRNDADQGIDLGAGTYLSEDPGDRFGCKGSAFKDTNPMKGNPVFDQVAVGVGEKIGQDASL